MPVTWWDEYLDMLVHDVIIRYLAIAHFGRGQGQYVVDAEDPRFWIAKVKILVSKHLSTLHEEWKRLREHDPVARGEEKSTRLMALLSSITLELLGSTYPASKRFLSRLG